MEKSDLMGKLSEPSNNVLAKKNVQIISTYITVIFTKIVKSGFLLWVLVGMQFERTDWHVLGIDWH